MITKPSPDSAPEYYHYYIGLLSEADLLEALDAGQYRLEEWMRSIPSNKELFAYADKKWTVRQVIQHIIDTERILSYRALRFARRDATILPGFDENFFGMNDETTNVTLEQQVQEFRAVRAATIALYRSLSDESLNFLGNANGVTVSARAIGWMIAGHAEHHAKVVRERYLNS